MKINLRVQLWEQDVQKAVRNTPPLNQHIDDSNPSILVLWIDTDSKEFDRILEITKGTSGFKWTPQIELSESEMVDIQHFRLWGRKIIRENNHDYECNRTLHDKAVWTVEHDDLKIKLPKKIIIGNINLKPNMVGYAGDWREEYIIGELVARVFKKSKLTGFNILPVYKKKNKKHVPHREFFQLYTETIAPAAVLDITVQKITGLTKPEWEEWGQWPYQCRGLLAYSKIALNKSEDFFRTAEPWADNQSPYWIVSRNVKECFEKNHFKGLKFLPVLQTESPLYAQYLSKWKRVWGRLMTSSQHELW